MSKLNTEIKISFMCLAVAVTAPLCIVLFALLPTYNLVGTTGLHTNEVIHRSELIIRVLSPLAILALIGFIVLIVLGLLKVGRRHGD